MAAAGSESAGDRIAWATPVPKVQNDDELNAYLLQCCRDEMQRSVAGQSQTIGQRFEQDRAAACPLPPRPFDPCIYQPAKVDKYQTAAFDTNHPDPVGPGDED